MILPQAEACYRLMELLALVGGIDLNPAGLKLVFADEETTNRYGLDWSRAEGAFEGCDCGCEDDEDHECECGHDPHEEHECAASITLFGELVGESVNSAFDSRGSRAGSLILRAVYVLGNAA